MNEVQFWHWVATSVLGILIMLLSYWGSTLSKEVKEKVSKDDFKAYLVDASLSRKELRESIVQLFEKSESHERLDRDRFEQLAKDFNGGLARLTDILYNSKVEILRELNGKADK